MPRSTTNPPPNSSSKRSSSKPTRSHQRNTDTPTTERHDPRITDRLTDRIGQHRYGMWFDHTTRLTIEQNRLNIAAESQFVADWIKRHFRQDLEAVVRETIGENGTIDLHVSPESFHPAEADGRSVENERGPRGTRSAVPETDARSRSDESPAAKRRNFRRQQLRRLNEFVIGNSNRLAYEAAQSIGEDIEGAPSMLFIHGECGVGKTHLLQGVVEKRQQAIGNPIMRRRIRYVTGEEFTNEYIAAVRSGKIDGFRTRMRQLDLLAIDDIHFLSNKTATQNEFLHTLDAIGLGGACILLASDEHPRQIGRFSASLTSRFLSGMVVGIGRPDPPMREELVRRIAEDHDLELTETAARLLSGRFTGSVRELGGALTKLSALRRLDGARGGPVGAIMVEQMFEGDLSSGPRTPVRLGEIISSVCERLGIEPDELLGRGRHRRVVLARSLVVHLARELTTLSFPEIARGLGRENHSTVHTAARRIERELAESEADEGQPTAALPLQSGDNVTLRELVEQLKYDILRSSARR
ncbi:MAG: DnaA/Hda family protein [Planctomycetota bacterium]|nr:DnaA/Hda family protein [Planctomycetota bacterium]